MRVAVVEVASGRCLLDPAAHPLDLGPGGVGLGPPLLDPIRLDAWCDSMASILAVGQQHNFTIWRSLGTFVWPNPLPVPETYAGEIQDLKDWMHGRWRWLDQNIPGPCDLSIAGENPATSASAVVVFPNPFQERFTVRIPGGTRVQRGVLTDMTGRTIMLQNTASPERPEFQVPHDLADGPYVLRLFTEAGPLHVSVVRNAR